MARRLPLALLLLPFLLASPAAGDTVDRKQNVDERIAALEEKMHAAAAREDSLAARIESVTADIQSLQRTVGDVGRKLESLQQDLALHRERLAKLTELLRLQTERLYFLRRQYAEATAAPRPPARRPVQAGCDRHARRRRLGVQL